MSTIAIFGLNGALGQPAIEALTSEPFSSKVKFPLRLFTGKEKPATTSEKKYFNYNDETEVAEGLEGVDVLVDLRKAGSSDLGPAAKKAGVKAYILSEFGVDFEGTAVEDFVLFKVKVDYKKKIQSYGIKTVEIITAFFADWVWGEPLGLQISRANNTFYSSDPSRKISVIFLKDVGKVIASIATKPVSEIKSKVRVSADVVTPGSVAAIYEKASGEILKKDPYSKEKWAQIRDDIVSGKSTLQPAFLWLLGSISATIDGGAYFEKNDNDYVNGGAFEWTKFEPEAEKAWAKK